MPPAVPITLLAVVAGDGNDPGQVGGDGLEGDAHGHGLPGRGHRLVGFGRLLADGAAGVERGELSEAVPVDGVAAGHLVRGRTGAEQILLTDGTVLHVLADLAVVLSEEGGVDAHAAVVAVAEVLGSTDAAEAALGTVIGAFLGRHPQVADGAVVLSELDTAADTVVPVQRIIWTRSFEGSNDVCELEVMEAQNEQATERA